MRFEELDRRSTPMGEVTLRRRQEPSLGVDVYEAKLDDEFLMSSLFTATEVALADLALAQVTGDDLDVAVGGLGLGYTARAVLQDRRVRSLHVIEAHEAVIDWHRWHLLPLSPELTADPRCRLVNADFFAAVATEAPLPAARPERHDAILVDIDHSPRKLLHPSHRAFYTVDGLRRLGSRLQPGGVFALWSDDPPDEEFLALGRHVFASYASHVVTFRNPLTEADAASTVYLARETS